jgi:hypothetical protein
VEGWLRRKFEGRLQEVVLVAKEDLDLVREGGEGAGGGRGVHC